jgi:prepilin-type N-terminal cleavage/methylation domain-containing protein
MLRSERGFTLIELMIVCVVMGILIMIAIVNYASMQNRARITQVRETMHIVQLAAEEFSTRNNGSYPQNAASTTADGGLTLNGLLPGGGLPENPFTVAPTNLDWTNALGSVPVTDAAGGVSFNVTQSVAGGTWDTYDIVGTSEVGAPLNGILKNY